MKLIFLSLLQANLTELKSFGKPPAAVVNVTSAVMVLLSPPNKIPRDKSWNACKIMMGKVRTAETMALSKNAYLLY